MSRMRIAFLTHEPFYPPSGGGSAEAIYLIEAFVRHGHELHLFCPAFPGVEEVAKRFGISIHPFTRWEMGRYTRARNLKYLAYPSALTAHAERVLCGLRRRLGDGFQFDALLSQHTISAVAAGSLRKRWRIPAVFNYLDYLTGFMETWPAIFTRTGFVSALKRFEMGMPRRFDAEGVMTVSTPLAERFANTGYPAKRICAIQYGYDANLFAPLADGRPIDPPVVVMHGSFDQHHLGPIAFETVKRVHSRKPDVIFKFVGRQTGTLSEFTARLRAACPALRLELPGFVPYAEISAHLNRATVGWIPYEESEGVHCAFVAKAVEYLGCGIPVASTPLENLRRYFAGEEAIRFSGFDPESLAAALLQWLDAPQTDRRRVGTAAAMRVRRELDWPVIAEMAVNFFEHQTINATIGRKAPNG